VRYQLRKELAEFLKKKRGRQTFAKFSRKIGLSTSTLQRIEVMQQNVSLDTLEQLLNRLHCRMSDIFRN